MAAVVRGADTDDFGFAEAGFFAVPPAGFVFEALPCFVGFAPALDRLGSVFAGALLEVVLTADFGDAGLGGDALGGNGLVEEGLGGVGLGSTALGALAGLAISPVLGGPSMLGIAGNLGSSWARRMFGAATIIAARSKQNAGRMASSSGA